MMMYVEWEGNKIPVRRTQNSWILEYRYGKESVTDHHFRWLVNILNMCLQVKLYPSLNDYEHLGYVKGFYKPIVPKSRNAIKNAALIIDRIFPGSIYIDREKSMVFLVNAINLNEYEKRWLKLINSKEVDIV